MKNKTKTFLIIFTCLFLLLAGSLKADSGWDGDYDYDYDSDWDFDFDWDNDYDYDYDYGSSHTPYRGNGSNDDLGGALLAFVIFLGVGALIVVIALKSAQKNKTTGVSQSNTNLPSFDIEKIKEILPDFDVNKFRMDTFEIYKKIQESWMNFDNETLKQYTTNELFNLYKSELIALKAKKQKNIMSDFFLEDFDIIDMEKGTDDISIKVRMSVSCLDYVVDSNNSVKRGLNNRKVIYGYEMTFTKGLANKDNKCPNCNAPLKNVQTSVCPYCNSTVISANHDWVLSKKQVITQRLK